jgi:NADH:ubiquinone oxidoreductase subunit C
MDRSLRTLLEAKLGDRLTGPVRQRHDNTEIRVRPTDVIEVMRTLHDDPDLEFVIIADLSGVDTGTTMQVVYHLW